MIDKLMQQHGYTKTREDKYGVYYEKKEKQGFAHVVCVLHKESGHHLMQSYDREVLKIGERYVCEGCGVEIPVLLLMWLKAKYLSIKFHWERPAKGEQHG